MPKKSNTKKSQDDPKLFAFLAVFLSIIGFIIAVATKKEDRYVMYYAKQSLVLFVFSIILYVGSSILIAVTFGLGIIILPAVWILLFVLWIFQIVNSVSGEEKETPLIGNFGDKIDL